MTPQRQKYTLVRLFLGLALLGPALAVSADLPPVDDESRLACGAQCSLHSHTTGVHWYCTLVTPCDCATAFALTGSTISGSGNACTRDDAAMTEPSRDPGDCTKYMSGDCSLYDSSTDGNIHAFNAHGTGGDAIDAAWTHTASGSGNTDRATRVLYLHFCDGQTVRDRLTLPTFANVECGTADSNKDRCLWSTNLATLEGKCRAETANVCSCTRE